MSPETLLLSHRTKGRLEAFSDGVFAIVITLLVLELHVLSGTEQLAHGLGVEWPRYLGYVVSFAFIGGVWVAHSSVTHFIKAVDATLMRVNLTLAALMIYLVVRHIDRTDELAADDVIEEQLQGFVRGRRTAVVLQAIATAVGAFLPAVAVVVYLGLSVFFFFVDPLWIERVRRQVWKTTP